MTEKSTERKLVIPGIQSGQKAEKPIFPDPQGPEDCLAKNMAAKKVMAAELSAMGLSKESIARLLNLENTKE